MKELQMPKWPQSCPEDLRPKLKNVLSYRDHGPAEIWGEVREWLIAHGVEAPEKLPEPDELEGRVDQ